MMLRWAACISSGSAFFNPFDAASLSPLLMAVSTVRTAPRIWVRRDLLMMVRRAILRVAFLAEVVLAIAQNFLQRRPVVGMARLIDVDRRGRRGLGSGRSLKCRSRSRAAFAAKPPRKPPKKASESRQRAKNSGGGIAPAAIAGPYRGVSLQRQRFPGGAGPGRRPGGSVKVLER